MNTMTIQHNNVSSFGGALNLVLKLGNGHSPLQKLDTI